MELGATFDHYITALGKDQHLPQRKFLKQALFGILSSQSPLLSQIARALDEKANYDSVERRLSENLKNPRMDDEALRRAYLEYVKPLLRDKKHRTPTIAVDKTDVSKPWAKKMPFLARVRDASLPYRPRSASGDAADVITNPGYDVVNIEAVGDDGRRLPLYMRLYSHADPDCKRELGETRRAIHETKAAVPREAIWVFDRGYCNRPTIEMLKGARIRWVCRMPLKRGMEIYANGNRGQLEEIVSRVRTRVRMRVRKYKKNKKLIWNVKVGWITNANLPRARGPTGHSPDHTKYSVVVLTNNLGKEPLVLLTNIRVASAEAAKQVAHAYHERWGVEEAHRFLKSELSLEKIRALTWVGVQRMALFIMLAYGYLASLVHRWRPLAMRIAKEVKAFGPVPRFVHYRLLWGGWGMPFEPPSTEGRRP